MDDVDLLDVPVLVDGELQLHLVERTLGDRERNRVPAYRFDLRVGGLVAGSASLRVGHTPYLERYAGHIGYGVEYPFRGHRYAARACRLMFPLARHHRMTTLWTSSRVTRRTSRRGEPASSSAASSSISSSFRRTRICTRKASGRNAGIAFGCKRGHRVHQAGRPLFLGGGFILYALGAAVAAAAGHPIDVTRYALGQAAVTALQLMTHYANDYFDYEADVANPTPTAVGAAACCADGTLPRSVALVAALVLAGIGVAFTLVLGTAGVGSYAIPTLMLVLVLAWSYSAPPFRLCARGLGELDTALVVTVLVPWLGFYLQAPSMHGATGARAGRSPPALLQFAMLVAIEFPDAVGDAATGKRTLVVRLGAPVAARLYAVITAAAFVWPLVAFALGLPLLVALAMLVPTPIAIWRIMQLGDHANRDAYERLTFFAVFLVVATSAAALIGWLSVR